MNLEDEDRERKLVAAFASRRVDGLIIHSSSQDHSYFLTERKAGTAIAFVDRPPAFLDADTVPTNNAAGVRRRAEQLIALGHRRIGYLGNMHTIATASERHRGYLEALADHNLEVDERLVRMDLRGIEK